MSGYDDVIYGGKSCCMLFILIIFSQSLASCSTEKKGLEATETIRDVRKTKCPLKPAREIDKMKRKTYNYRFDTKNEIIAVRWKDNKLVALASNFDRIESLATTKQWSKELKKVSIP